jgi:hypothetical protein
MCAVIREQTCCCYQISSGMVHFAVKCNKTNCACLPAYIHTYVQAVCTGTCLFLWLQRRFFFPCAYSPGLNNVAMYRYHKVYTHQFLASHVWRNIYNKYGEPSDNSEYELCLALHVRICIQRNLHMCLCMYVCMYVCMCVCIVA